MCIHHQAVASNLFYSWQPSFYFLGVCVRPRSRRVKSRRPKCRPRPDPPPEAVLRRLAMEGQLRATDRQLRVTDQQPQGADPLRVTAAEQEPRQAGDAWAQLPGEAQVQQEALHAAPRPVAMKYVLRTGARYAPAQTARAAISTIQGAAWTFIAD